MSNQDWITIGLYFLSMWGFIYYESITGETAYLKLAWGSLMLGLFFHFVV